MPLPLHFAWLEYNKRIDSIGLLDQFRATVYLTNCILQLMLKVVVDDTNANAEAGYD